MRCRDVPNFEQYIRDWVIRTDSEAADVIRGFTKGGESMAQAVALTIESLPSRKTTRLRRLVELFEPHCEWMEDWASKGYRMQAYARGAVAAVAPPELTFDVKGDEDSTAPGKDFPSEEIVAAAMGVESAKFSLIKRQQQVVGAVYQLGRVL